MTNAEKSYLIAKRLGLETNNFVRSEIMDALEEIEELEPTRTLDQIHDIVACVRAGIPVQVDYYDEEQDDQMIVRACW